MAQSMSCPSSGSTFKNNLRSKEARTNPNLRDERDLIHEAVSQQQDNSNPHNNQAAMKVLKRGSCLHRPPEVSPYKQSLPRQATSSSSSLFPSSSLELLQHPLPTTKISRSSSGIQTKDSLHSSVAPSADTLCCQNLGAFSHPSSHTQTRNLPLVASSNHLLANSSRPSSRIQTKDLTRPSITSPRVVSFAKSTGTSSRQPTRIAARPPSSPRSVNSHQRPLDPSISSSSSESHNKPPQIIEQPPPSPQSGYPRSSHPPSRKTRGQPSIPLFQDIQPASATPNPQSGYYPKWTSQSGSRTTLEQPPIQGIQTPCPKPTSPPAAQTNVAHHKNLVWTSPLEKHRTRYTSLRTQAHHLGFLTSPFFLPTLRSYLSHLESVLITKLTTLRRQLATAAMTAEEDSFPTGPRIPVHFVRTKNIREATSSPSTGSSPSVGGTSSSSSGKGGVDIPPMGGKVFVKESALSAVLAQPSVFNNCWVLDDRFRCAWPSAGELRRAGAEGKLPVPEGVRTGEEGRVDVWCKFFLFFLFVFE